MLQFTDAERTYAAQESLFDQPKASLREVDSPGLLSRAVNITTLSLRGPMCAN